MERRRGSFSSDSANIWITNLLQRWQDMGNEVGDLIGNGKEVISSPINHFEIYYTFGSVLPSFRKEIHQMQVSHFSTKHLAFQFCRRNLLMLNFKNI
nr:unnamed protein product [Callosobruchus analis]